MATVILLRHGRSTANTAGVLAGRLPGISLDEVGTAQVAELGERLAGVPVSRVVSSSVQRCLETARGVVDRLPVAPQVEIDHRLDECDYGDWQGRTLKDLAGEPLWKTVQRHPSAATFPGGEAMTTMSTRAVAAVRETDAAVETAHGPGAVWVAVSHGDLVKAVLADALGLHLDQFQRIGVDPASASVIRYTPDRPYVLASNTRAGDLAWTAATPHPSAGAAVGGGAGPDRAAGEPDPAAEPGA